MHDNNAAGHEERRTSKQRRSQSLPPDNMQGNAGGNHSREPRNRRHQDIERHGDIHRHSTHSDKVHGPDAGSHQHRASGQPFSTLTVFGVGQPGAEEQAAYAASTATRKEAATRGKSYSDIISFDLFIGVFERVRFPGCSMLTYIDVRLDTG